MELNNKKARVIAFYLPQFHPIPENDKWWGKGFTEWTNVGKAQPLFKGHYQPRVPADLGYYDLRMPEVREAQAQMAREAGIEGFCYWHYWFGNGKQLLERPFNEVLASGKPDFPFCLGWANETWTNKSWEKGTRKVKESVLVQQEYSEEDYEKHFYAILPALKDKRYICVENKPLFLVYQPTEIPNQQVFCDVWHRLARENGLAGIHLVGVKQNYDLDHQDITGLIVRQPKDIGAEEYTKILNTGFDAVNSRGYWRASAYGRPLSSQIKRYLMRVLFNVHTLVKIPQRRANQFLYVKADKWENVYPTLIPQWDRTARSGRKAHVWTNSTPEVFRKQMQAAMKLIEHKQPEHRILFLQSWNEWAEGNYVEPDLKYGHGFLDVLRGEIFEKTIEKCTKK